MKEQKPAGMIIPVIITVYADRSSHLLQNTTSFCADKEGCKIESGSGVPNKEKVATYQRMN